MLAKVSVIEFRHLQDVRESGTGQRDFRGL